MRKELGKWLLDVAKYILTAGLIASWLTTDESYTIWISSAMALIFIILLTWGLRILKAEEERERRREKIKIKEGDKICLQKFRFHSGHP